MVNSNPKGRTARNGFEAKVQNALAGVQKYLPADSTLEINGATMTVARIVADFSAMLTKFSNVRSAKAEPVEQSPDRAWWARWAQMQGAPTTE